MDITVSFVISTAEMACDVCYFKFMLSEVKKVFSSRVFTAVSKESLSGITHNF
jgi:hypothetical protein